MHSTVGIEAKPISKSNSVFILKIFASVFALSLVFFGLSSLSTTQDSNTLAEVSDVLSTKSGDMDDTESQIVIDVSNEYTKIYGQSGIGYPWIEFPVVEPYRTTTLEVLNEEEGEHITYYWTINKNKLDLIGPIIEIEFKDLEYHLIKVEKVDTTSGKVLKTGFQKVVCKYVKREIRTLTDKDREEYFEAAYVVYNTPNLEGQKLYGPKFKDITSIVIFHNLRAGDILCDHMHDGYGFLTSHFAYSLVFEQALQSVNPRVTLPYWDFTIDTADILTSGSFEAFYQSIVFSDDWFGDAKPENKIVTSGRFAYTPVESHMFNKTSTYNAYGFLRAPWNQNKIPYITRYNAMCGYRITHFPTCTSHYELLQIDTFGEFATIAQYVPHGSLHTLLGGIWGADWKSYTDEWGFDMSSDISNFLFVFLKIMYRTRVLKCPEFCSLDTPNTVCKCTCPNFDIYVNDKEQLSTLVDTIFADKVSDDFKLRFLELGCNKYDDLAPVIGDHLESASPNDISFWPIHPTIDRLYHWRMIHGFSSMHWEDDAAWSLWTGITSKSGYCKGHNLDDEIGFADLFKDAPGSYTNADLLHYMNANTDRIPYIYDNFKWDHCTQFGYSTSLLEYDSSS